MTQICKLCISALFIQFFFVYVSDMACDNRLVALEQFCHLLLCEPYSLITHPHLQPDSHAMTL